jgi:uncharacterized protein YcbK (DUF882 family)
MGNRSKNFSDHEFRCKCRQRAPHLPECKQKFVPDDLITILQETREHFGAPMAVHSGHRCGNYNKFVGGATHSQHVDANATDFTVKGVSPNEVQEYLLARYPTEHGIGRYNTFTHIDVRGSMARWDNRR